MAHIHEQLNPAGYDMSGALSPNDSFALEHPGL